MDVAAEVLWQFEYQWNFICESLPIFPQKNRKEITEATCRASLAQPRQLDHQELQSIPQISPKQTSQPLES